MLLNSRRIFLKKSFLTTAVLVMSGSEVFGAVSPLQTMAVVQEDLFPLSQNFGVKSSAYISLILNHSRVSDDEKAFLRNGVQWLNEEAILHYKQTYTKLSSTQRQKILQTISKERWGENWIHTILVYIMEATFSDKVYGVNKNESGQKWLQFTPGMPRPKEPLL